MQHLIKEECEKLYDETILKIQEIVQIPAVRDEENGKPGAPFGPGIDKSLDKFLEYAKELNMDVYKDPEGKYAYAEFGPKDADMIAILGHVDVVPVGDLSQWDDDPYSGILKNGKIYGRGVLDDKGPFIVTMMAFKSLINLEVNFNKRVRFIAGAAEETTFECILSYNEKEEKPSLAIVPDSDFPLINAEKAIFQFDIFSQENIDFDLIAEGAYNSVSDKVIYRGNQTEELIKELENLGFEYQVSDNDVIVNGIGAHASTPEEGINAIIRMAIALKNIGIENDMIDFLVNKIGSIPNGELLLGKVEDKISGTLTFNVANIKVLDQKLTVGCDTRIPVTYTTKDMVKNIETNIKEQDILIKSGKFKEKLYIEEDSFLVQSLLDTYKEVTGNKNAKPISIGGGTYARALENAVAFGIVFDEFGMERCMHQPNEALEVKYLPMALEIYAKAIYKLTR